MRDLHTRKPNLPLPHINEEPLSIVVERAGDKESEHQVDLAVVDIDGNVILSFGDIERQVFPRSAMKPLQSIALAELLRQYPDKGTLSPKEYALISASHNGEDLHVDAVHGLLARFDIDPEYLICGAHWSLDQATSLSQARALSEPTKAHNNCSGKHAGMLVLAQLMGAPLEGYHKISHPVQQRIVGVMEQMTGIDLMDYTHGVDGCGAPAVSGPLGNWAHGFAVFADRSTLTADRADAIISIRDGIAAAPLMIAGHGRCCSGVSSAYGDLVTVKTGAEGVFAAAFHDLGLGLLLKTRDGNKRGAEAALGAVFHILGYDHKPELDCFFNPVLKNWAGEEVGKISIPAIS